MSDEADFPERAECDFDPNTVRTFLFHAPSFEDVWGTVTRYRWRWTERWETETGLIVNIEHEEGA